MEYFKRRFHRYRDVVFDILKVLTVLCLSYFISSVPLYLIQEDIYPEEIKIPNLNESNNCFWIGDTGLLNNTNPCVYRGYVKNDREGRECMRWRVAIDGDNDERYAHGLDEERHGHVPHDHDHPHTHIDGVGMEEFRRKIEGGHFKFMLDDLEKWRRAYWNRGKGKNDPYMESIALDYNYRFCRRLGSNSSVNFATCLVDIDGEIQPSYCWLLPCEIQVTARCFQRFYASHDERGLKKKFYLVGK